MPLRCYVEGGTTPEWQPLVFRTPGSNRRTEYRLRLGLIVEDDRSTSNLHRVNSRGPGRPRDCLSGSSVSGR
jgi:hypothetical protein